MAVVKRRPNFSGSAEGLEVEQRLQEMVLDSNYHTSSSYSANSKDYPNHLIPFVDKHMKYLSENQAVNLEHYLSNLRLMTRRK